MLPWTWVYLFSHCFQSFLLWLRWVLIAACGLFIVVYGLSLVAVWWLLLLWHMDSPVVAHRLSCSEASGTLVPWPRIEPMSSALEGGFLTTGPLGKFLILIINCFTFLSSVFPHCHEVPWKQGTFSLCWHMAGTQEMRHVNTNAPYSSLISTTVGSWQTEDPGHFLVLSVQHWVTQHHPQPGDWLSTGF